MSRVLSVYLLLVFLLKSNLVWSQKEAVIPDLISLTYNTPAPPPEWALLQRQLINALYPAAMEFVNKYTKLAKGKKSN